MILKQYFNRSEITPSDRAFAVNCSYVELPGWAESATAGSRDAQGWSTDDYCRGGKRENKGAHHQNCPFDGQWCGCFQNTGADIYQQGCKGNEGTD